MTDNELKLIEMIREHNNPTKALVKAIEIITLCLALRESS